MQTYKSFKHKQLPNYRILSSFQPSRKNKCQHLIQQKFIFHHSKNSHLPSIQQLHADGPIYIYIYIKAGRGLITLDSRARRAFVNFQRPFANWRAETREKKKPSRSLARTYFSRVSKGRAAAAALRRGRD